jgi:DNA-binding XRE family transcriptional regulator
MAKVFKEEQEQCSIITTYYAIEKESKLEPDEDLDLKVKLTEVYPNMTEDWYITFLNQAKELKKYLKKSDWKYGWYDGKEGWATGIIENNKVSYIMSEIWDTFTNEQKKIFGGQKDSWNTADVFVVSGKEEKKIIKEVKELQKEFEEPVPPEVFVGTLNVYLSKLAKDNILFPISLKKQTKTAPVKVTPTNIDDIPLEGLTAFDGEFLAKPYSYFDIVVRNGKVNFKGNSLFWKSKFTVGSYPYHYQIEQRMQGKSSKAEVKDLVVKGKKGKRGPADAQTGNVPMPIMKELIKEYSKEDYDNKITPVGTPLDEKYWVDYFDLIYNKSKNSFDLGKLEFFGKSVSSKEFMKKAIQLDNMSDKDVKILYKAQKGDYSAKLRNKLRHLRTIKSILNSQKKNDLFSKFLMHIYFRSAKMNINNEDLVGPFLKVSS